MMSIRIDRCVCINRTFASLVEQARRDGHDLDELMRETQAARGCGLCRPYLREALQTGQTVFTQVITER